MILDTLIQIDELIPTHTYVNIIYIYIYYLYTLSGYNIYLRQAHSIYTHVFLCTGRTVVSFHAARLLFSTYHVAGPDHSTFDEDDLFLTFEFFFGGRRSKLPSWRWLSQLTAKNDKSTVVKTFKPCRIGHHHMEEKLPVLDEVPKGSGTSSTSARW